MPYNQPNSYNPGDFGGLSHNIGWVCSLPTEFVPVGELLGETHDSTYHRQAGTGGDVKRLLVALLAVVMWPDRHEDGVAHVRVKEKDACITTRVVRTCSVLFEDNQHYRIPRQCRGMHRNNQHIFWLAGVPIYRPEQ